MKQNLFNHVAGLLTVLSKIINFLMFMTIGVAIATFYPENVGDLVKYGEDVVLASIVFWLLVGLICDGISWFIERKYLKPIEAAEGNLTP